MQETTFTNTEERERRENEQQARKGMTKGDFIELTDILGTLGDELNQAKCVLEVLLNCYFEKPLGITGLPEPQHASTILHDYKRAGIFANILLNILCAMESDMPNADAFSWEE